MYQATVNERPLDAGAAMYQLVPRLILLDPLHRLIEPDPIGKNTVRGRSVTQRHQNRDVTFSRYRSGFKNIEHREVTRYRHRSALAIANPETRQDLMGTVSKYRAQLDAPLSPIPWQSIVCFRHGPGSTALIICPACPLGKLFDGHARCSR
jgi:hypothetical protein